MSSSSFNANWYSSLHCCGNSAVTIFWLSLDGSSPLYKIYPISLCPPGLWALSGIVFGFFNCLIQFTTWYFIRIATLLDIILIHAIRHYSCEGQWYDRFSSLVASSALLIGFFVLRIKWIYCLGILAIWYFLEYHAMIAGWVDVQQLYSLITTKISIIFMYHYYQLKVLDSSMYSE